MDEGEEVDVLDYLGDHGGDISEWLGDGASIEKVLWGDYNTGRPRCSELMTNPAGRMWTDAFCEKRCVVSLSGTVWAFPEPEQQH